MTDKELKKIAAKIAKCLALSTSDNAGEADTARGQADALMKKYNLTTGDVAASQVHQKKSNTGGKHRPPVFLVQLAVIVSRAFGCGAIISNGHGWQSSGIEFLGIGIKPELSSYTFDVLSRQLKKDRSNYLATIKRYKRANKTRMANIFCEYWVGNIYQQVNDFSGSEKEKAAIKAYKERQYGNNLKSDNRDITKFKKQNDVLAASEGIRKSNKVSIHRPVQNKRNAILN